MTTQQDSVDVERLLTTNEALAKLTRAVEDERKAATTRITALELGLTSVVVNLKRAPAQAEAVAALASAILRGETMQDAVAAAEDALSLPITQRDEQGAKTYSDGIEDAAKVAERSAAYFRDFAVTNGASDEGAEAARIACEDLATAIRRLSIEQGDQDGGTSA